MATLKGSKRGSGGINDTSILITLITILLIIGWAAPMFGQPDYDIVGYGENVSSSVRQVNQETSFWSSLINGVSSFFLIIINAFIWTFDVPIWLNVILFIPMRVAILYLFVKVLRGIGG